MSFRSRGRINGWMQEFTGWAMATCKKHENDDKSNYYLGVIMGIRDAKAHRNLSPDVLDPVFHKGYKESRVLINKVLRLEDAPEGNIGDLLALPELTPLRPRLKR